MTITETDPAKLARFLLARLPGDVRGAVDLLAGAAPQGRLYAVGGTIRDVLLGRSIVDVDLAVEADAIALARAALPAARLTTHARFRTATVTVAGMRIDVATARRETYVRPGALPAVAPSDIEDDLRRRDFSVNALALRLYGEPALLDPCNGRGDLDAGLIRVLHDRSFADDATRILRALRYATRLGFALEAETARLLTPALRYVDTIGGERLRREVELMIGEEQAGAALEVCQRAGALQALHPALHWNADKSRAFRSEVRRHVPPVPFAFALLAAGASVDEAVLVCRRLKLKRDEAAAVDGVASMRRIAPMLRRPDARPSGVVLLLDRFPRAAVAAFAMTTGDAIARELALRYVDEWRFVKPALSGRDLIEMGVPAGPQVQQGLRLIRAARLDGWAGDRDDERALVARFARSIRDAGTTTTTVELEPGGN